MVSLAFRPTLLKWLWSFVFFRNFCLIPAHLPYVAFFLLEVAHNQREIPTFWRSFPVDLVFQNCSHEGAKEAAATRSALVNIRRKALLSSVGFRKRMTSRSPRSFICTSIVYIRLVWFLVRDFVPLFRSFLDWFQSIQTRRCHCLRLKDVLMFQASSYSAGKRTFQWMLLNNILWMAPDHQAVYLGDNYTLSLSLLNTCTV